MRLNSANINVMVNACRKAAKILIRDFGEVEKLQVSPKGPGDFVSASDKKVEKILIEEFIDGIEINVVAIVKNYNVKIFIKASTQKINDINDEPIELIILRDHTKEHKDLLLKSCMYDISVQDVLINIAALNKNLKKQ